MAIAGKLARVKISGTPVVLANASTSEITEGLVYQILNAAHRVLSPSDAVVVKYGATGSETTADPTEYTVDRLTGTITFDAALGASDVVTVGGKYLPTSSIAEAKEYSLSITANNVDASTWDDAGVDGWTRRKQGKLDVSGSIGRFADVDHAFFDLIDAATPDTPLVIEFYTDGGVTPDARAFVVFESDEISAASDALVEESISFVGQPDDEGRAISYL